MARPVIGISGPDRGGWVAWLFTSLAVRMCGAHAVRITPERGAPREIDGLVLGGGADVSPTRYQRSDPPPPLREALTGKRGRSKLRVLIGYVLAPLVYLVRLLLSAPRAGLDPARDELESGLLSHALREDLPVLGICRGAQLLNVQLGGTLHRGLEDFYVERPNRWTVLPRKQVRIELGSRLHSVLGVAKAAINSLHRQAVDRLGTGLRAVATEDNGVVQAVELAEHAFAIGVQWHPEYIPQRPEQRRLFRELVRAATLRRASQRGFVRTGEQSGVERAVAQENSQRIDDTERR
jgi:putative glutamine amidotransferase